MTDEQIRVAIAEACGWRFHPDGFGYVPPGGNQWIGRGYKSLAECVPDYPNDLNAMREAEKVLTFDHNGALSWTMYANILMRVCGSHQSCIHATARQKAEAFLRTLDKLTDS